MTQPARILVIEPHASGHHSTYLRWVVQAITERGWSAVVATTAGALEHPLLAGLDRMAGVEVRTLDVELPLSPAPSRLTIIRCELVYWRALRRIVKAELARGPITAVVLPYLDYCFFACGVLGVPYRGVPWHVVSMRLSALEGAGKRGIPWKWWLARHFLASPWVRTLFSISPSVRRLPRGWLTAEAVSKFKYLPDPAEHRGALDRGAARARLGLERKQIAILVFGTIDERKGLERLAAALEADQELRPYVVLVAGKQLKALLTEPPFVALRRTHRIISLDRVLDDAEQAEVFAAADVVWLGYDGHSYMSGVLALAGHAGLPVIATDEGEVGAFVREHEMGALIEPANTPSTVTALLQLMDERSRSSMGRRARAALMSHTPANLKRDLVTAIEAG